jgi:hypothetical protein
MKAAFKIFPHQTDISDKHLLIEAGWEGISFVLFSKSPLAIHGLLVYNFEKNLLASEVAQEIAGIINNESILKQQVNSVTICSNFKESILVPSKFYDESTNADMFDTFFGKGIATISAFDKIEEQDIYNVYRLEVAIMQKLQKFYPGSALVHSSSFQLKKLTNYNDALSCIVYHNAIKVIVHKENKLQLVQYFSYNVALDVIYHLLNVCSLHQISIDKIHLILSGMIDEKSNLYSELYKYFLHIHFYKLADEIVLNEALQNYPLHFFGHLIYLASCVS